MTGSPADVLLVFDFADRAGGPRRLGFTRPLEVVIARAPGEVRPALRRVRRAAEAGHYAAGFVSYEAAPAFDPALSVRASSALPLVWFGMLLASEDRSLWFMGLLFIGLFALVAGLSAAGTRLLFRLAARRA